MCFSAIPVSRVFSVIPSSGMPGNECRRGSDGGTVVWERECVGKKGYL